MQKESKNKAMSADGEQTKVETKKDDGLQDFHFSGGGEYKPLTVRARSTEEANKLWEDQRQKVKKD